MEFKILSHAGLLVKNKSGKSLICDPWLVGSSYWRSWWNYPPVSKELINSLQPDFIYLTHIHWDHFHGDSLKKFRPNIPIIVPKGNYTRMKDDLFYLGYNNIIELKHGERLQIDDHFSITSYQFWMFLDSALLIECDGVKLLNLNDSKHMGLTLKQIVRKHQPIDFVFRSHSSANERLSYEIVDEPGAPVDDLERYIKEFAQTARATRAKYAIPFASNHCHLHKDSFHFNQYIQHPLLVEDYFKQHQIQSPQVKVMVSGDSWSSASGFTISDKDWFTNRTTLLADYLQQQSESLEKFYLQENRAEIDKQVVVEYFEKFSATLPFFVRRYFKNVHFTYVLSAGNTTKYIYHININQGRVVELPPDTPLDHTNYPIQIHTTAFIFLRGIEFKIFSHMCIGKRVFYKVTAKQKKYMEALNLVFNAYEYDLLPIRRLFTWRSVESWSMRWREVILYMQLAKDKLVYGKLDIDKYLK
ncbi:MULTISPECIES: MBL fold metallo-hydrolase [Niastella]|uniref:MBL fold metallo-hydrolase n=1 Tax=Niastella soli TaxID=2821487 RepID=A0ABS3YUZ6_9BACT|nr:MBL fold metallo-hydrolase [Niastella soli]MBO9201751.1 MBL fold metallo-hydrolase [Niastella soli]